MKRFWSKLLCVLGCVFMITSCSPSGSLSIKFKVLPEETYDITESENDIKNRIIVTLNGRDYNLNQLDEVGATVSGLDFSNTGKHTLIVSYGGKSISYEYEVIGDVILSSFAKASNNLDLDAEEGYVFGFNSKTGEMGLYNKSTYTLKETGIGASEDVYFVANKASDLDGSSLNSYIITDSITLEDTLVFDNPVDLISTKASNAINGDVVLESNKEVNVKLDTDIYGSLTINCPNGHIEHNGQVSEAIIEAVSDSTFVANGVYGTLILGNPSITLGTESEPNNGNVVIGEKAIVNKLDTNGFSSTNTITNNGTIYRIDGDHAVVDNGFIFDYAVCNGSKNYTLPGFSNTNNTITIEGYKVAEVNVTIANADDLEHFSLLTQSGKSPLIQDQPLVNVGISNDIDMSGKEWIPIANWNYWANGVAARWFSDDNNSGWKNFCIKSASDSKLSSIAKWDFVSEDEMYCRAFYNDNYLYNGLKVEPIYYIRLVLDGNSHTISGLDNSFIGCLSYSSNIHDLTLSYNSDSTEKEWDGYNLIWNNLDGINMRGYLDTEVNTHFGLFCNNIYIPQDSDGKYSGKIKISNVALGGKFIYRNCNTDFGANGSFVTGAFISCVAAPGSNVVDQQVNTVLDFSGCALDDDLDFVITKGTGDNEKICQWPSSGTKYTSNAKSYNYALLADFCCGKNYTQARSYSNFENDSAIISTIGAQAISKVSNYQSGYSGTTCVCSSSKDVTIWEANCYHGKVTGKVCSNCGKLLNNDYTCDGVIEHCFTPYVGKKVTEKDSLKIGNTYVFVSLNANDNKLYAYEDDTKSTCVSLNSNNTLLPNDAMIVTLVDGTYTSSKGVKSYTGSFGLRIGSEGSYSYITSYSKETNGMGNGSNAINSGGTQSWNITIENGFASFCSNATSDSHKGKYLGFDSNTGTFKRTTTDLENIQIYEYNLNDLILETEPTINNNGNINYHHCSCCDNYFDIDNNSIAKNQTEKYLQLSSLYSQDAKTKISAKTEFYVVGFDIGAGYNDISKSTLGFDGIMISDGNRAMMLKNDKTYVKYDAEKKKVTINGTIIEINDHITASNLTIVEKYKIVSISEDSEISIKNCVTLPFESFNDDNLYDSPKYKNSVNCTAFEDFTGIINSQQDLQKFINSYQNVSTATYNNDYPNRIIKFVGTKENPIYINNPGNQKINSYDVVTFYYSKLEEEYYDVGIIKLLDNSEYIVSSHPYSLALTLGNFFTDDDHKYFTIDTSKASGVVANKNASEIGFVGSFYATVNYMYKSEAKEGTDKIVGKIFFTILSVGFDLTPVENSIN